MKYNNKSIKEISLEQVIEASSTMRRYLAKTDVVTSLEFNEIFGNKVYFKLENFQTTGSFKFRGALYSVLKLRDAPPKEIVTYGTGNHAVALAWAASKFLNIKIKAYLAGFTSEIKKKLAQDYGAELIIVPTRKEAEQLAKNESKKEGVLLLPPSDSDDMIAGAGTLILEALESLELEKPDALFVPIGGGSIVSGSYVVTKARAPNAYIYGAEPISGNDAARSYREKKIFRFDYDPETIADGAKTPGLSERTFNYVRKISGIYEILEKEIEYWTCWFAQVMKMRCEPTSALAIAAAFRWSQEKQNKNKRVLIVITGHNINENVYENILEKDYVQIEPHEFYSKNVKDDE